MRNEIIFLTIAVVILSLFGQGLTLPWVVRKMAKQPSKPAIPIDKILDQV